MGRRSSLETRFAQSGSRGSDLFYERRSTSNELRQLTKQRITMPTGLTLVLLVGLAGGHVQASVAMECRDASECRQLALEARSRDDFEAFHDLAWRALQKGGQNNPELMTLVARAQSLSGRPHDALVMLNRLADLKVVTDAATSDDFRRVRELPGWADLEARTTDR